VSFTFCQYRVGTISFIRILCAQFCSAEMVKYFKWDPS